MYAVSADFSRLIRESGVRKTVADVYYDGEMIASGLAVSDGSIRIELDGQVRRSGSITVADPRLVPTLTSTLSPLGTEIRIRQGVIFPNGTEELIPVGVFRLDVTSWSELDRVSTIQLYDRSKALQAELPSPHSRSGQLAKSVIIDFLEWFYPSLAPINPAGVFDPSLVDYRLPGGHVFESSNHWDPVVELARNMGGRLYFDVDGSPRCDPIEELSDVSTYVETIDAGPSGVLIEADRTYSREGVYNSVVVIGASTTGGAIPRSVVYNLDPGSPLRYGGPFGKTGIVINDSALTTETQCFKRARTELARYTGLSYSLDFSSVPNPALDVGDVIRAIYPDGSFELHQINDLTLPLGKGSFTGSSKGVYLSGQFFTLS